MKHKMIALISQSVVLQVVIGILLIALISCLWTWSLQACSTGRPNIRNLYEIETVDFYEYEWY